MSSGVLAVLVLVILVSAAAAAPVALSPVSEQRTILCSQSGTFCDPVTGTLSYCYGTSVQVNVQCVANCTQTNPTSAVCTPTPHCEQLGGVGSYCNGTGQVDVCNIDGSQSAIACPTNGPCVDSNTNGGYGHCDIKVCVPIANSAPNNSLCPIPTYDVPQYVADDVTASESLAYKQHQDLLVRAPDCVYLAYSTACAIAFPDCLRIYCIDQCNTYNSCGKYFNGTSFPSIDCVSRCFNRGNPASALSPHWFVSLLLAFFLA